MGEDLDDFLPVDGFFNIAVHVAQPALLADEIPSAGCCNLADRNKQDNGKDDKKPCQRYADGKHCKKCGYHTHN